jgi:hypothetical protein
VIEWRPVFAPSEDGDSQRWVTQGPVEWEAALAETAAEATKSEQELDRGPAEERVAAPSKVVAPSEEQAAS